MKKLALFIFVLSLFACKKEFNEDETRFLRDFSAEIENVSLSKASVDIETRKVTFDDGDRIVVSNGTQTAEYVYSAQTQRFSSQDPLAESDSYTAYYPASDFVGMTSEGMQVTFPQQQEYNENIVREAPMKGVWNGSLFVFKNLCSIIKFQLNASEKMTSVEFSSAKASVCGAATVVGNNLTTDGTGAKSLSISLPSNFTPSQTRPVCLVVPAQLYEGGFIMKATFESGREWYQPLNRDITLQAGYINAMDVLTLTYFSGGDGTANNPYKIASVTDLQNLSAYVASADADKAAFKMAHYQQVADIDFKSATLQSIGATNDSSNPSYFKGTYDGNGYTISNVAITNANAKKAQGMFGYLDGSAHLKGIRINQASVNSNTWNNGILVGCVQSTSSAVIEDCVVTLSTVTSSDENNGGLVGKLMAGTIRNCSFSGIVKTTTSAKHQAAGIVGYVSNAGCLVESCSFDGTVTGSCGNVGGIIGSMVGSASVKKCSVSKNSVITGGTIANNGINIGGIVGYITGATGGVVESCVCEGTINAHYYDVGGIVGRDQGVAIKNCTFSGKVSSDYDDSAASGDNFSRVGGICGHIHGTGYAENCTVSGSVTGKSYVGGVVGWLEQGSAVACKINSATVKGVNYVGGVVGRFKAGIVKSCTLNTPSVSGTKFIGGVSGVLLNTSSLSDCTVNDATITGSDMCVGGVAGLFSAGGFISQCNVNNSKITSSTKLAGGILGNMDSCTNAQQSKVERCNVTGGTVQVSTGSAGGILGGSNTYGIVNLCTSSANVTCIGTGANGNVGGIVGWVQSTNLLVANSVYYNGQLSNSGTSGGVAGICGCLSAASFSVTAVVNCCAFPSKVSTGSGNANIAGIAGYVNTVTIQNCYSPVPSSALYFNGAASGSSRGSIYGWLRGVNTTDACSGVIKDVYWLDGFKVGNFSGNYKYVKSEQSLTDAQMRNTGAVSRPSTSTAYADFLGALNAGAADYNNSPVFDVRAEEWVMGTNGYPVIYGTLLANSSATSSKVRVSLLGDSITTYKGYTMYPSNGQYPNSNYSDFTSVSQTYWYQLIYNKMTNAVLEVNSAYTGTCVQNTTSKGHPGYGFLQRYVDLGNPDVIFINGGTNDAWSYSLPVGTLDFTKATEDLDTYQFAQAYDKLIRLIRAKYPKAKVFCIIGDNVMDAGKTAYAKVIRDVCNQCGLHYAEVVFSDRASSTYDNVHPNVAGMKDMANQIWNQVKNYL